MTMEAAFLKILNMSLSASILILVVLLVRLLLFRAPKWVRGVLWAIVAVRLVLPFSIESIFSLIPAAEPIPNNIALMEHPAVETGIPIVNRSVNPVIERQFAPNPANSINPLQVVTYAAAIIWIAGVCGMLLFLFLSCLRAKNSVRAAVPNGSGVYLCDEIRSPFILGMFRPRIYLPSDLEGTTRESVLMHERAHLRRRDHWWKPLGFLILAVHWFNPLCWLAYILFCRDIESACDEKAIAQMDREGRAAYSQALLDCSRPQRVISVCPLAFGENGVKSRVKSVLHYKKPLLWIFIAAILVSVIVAVCFLTNPKAKREAERQAAETQTAAAETPSLSNAPESAEPTPTPWAGDGHWYTFQLTATGLISSIGTEYLYVPEEYTVCPINSVAIGKLKGMRSETKVYTADPEERVIWFESWFSYYRSGLALPKPDPKTCNYAISVYYTDSESWMYLSEEAGKELHTLLNRLDTEGEKAKISEFDKTANVYQTVPEIPGLLHDTRLLLTRRNGDAFLYAGKTRAYTKEGTAIKMNADSALFREFAAALDVRTTPVPLPVFTEIDGGITDGTNNYYDAPSHWHLFFDERELSFEETIGEIKIKDDAESDAHIKRVLSFAKANRFLKRWDKRYPYQDRTLIREGEALRDPFGDGFSVYLLNDNKNVDLPLSEEASAELCERYKAAENGTADAVTSIDENAEEYGTLILRNIRYDSILCYEFAGIRILGETIWLSTMDTGLITEIPKDTAAYTELMEIYKNNKLPQGVFVLH